MVREWVRELTRWSKEVLFIEVDCLVKETGKLPMKSGKEVG